MSNSAKPPIIIIQGDHGPGAFVHHDSLDGTYLQDRMAILNAYLMPGADKSVLDHSLTPVNTFRIIFNTYFSARLPLLPNRLYYSTVDRPYRFVEVTHMVDGDEDKQRLQTLLNHDYFPPIKPRQ
jgi:hypothetical protein